MSALDLIVRQGKALYVGLSNYNAEQTLRAQAILRQLGTPCLIHQPKYSMFVRDAENGLLDVLGKEQIGCIPFSPLAQGLLSDKYLNGIPEDSRVVTSGIFLNENHITQDTIAIISKLNNVAKERGQKLAQMALAWILRDSRITSVLIGSSKPAQIVDAIQALNNLNFLEEELNRIDSILMAK
jgi:L-glyceraldehyde 3-phosphate reductase